MNRGTVVLLALAILVAHTFAIHQTPNGDLGSTYEISYVAFRLGRNLAYDGAALWNPGGAAVESYPSPLWVLVSAVAARVYVSPILVAQAVGVVSALLAAAVLAQFSPKRTAGVIAPLLLAASGSAAAAALSGTEATLAMLLVTAAFLSFERGWGRGLALCLSTLILTRPEGLAITLALLVCEGLWRPRGEHARRPARWRAYPLPLLVALGGTVARRFFTGQWLSPFAAPLLGVDPGHWRVGLEYLLGFVLSSGFGLLFPVLLVSLLALRTSALGGRALLLTGVWWGLVVISGGDDLPFWNALVPVLPLFFLAVQESLREWMDERASLTHVAWPILLVSVGASFLVSKTPGDLGPLRLEALLMRWQTPGADLAASYPRPLGRLGLIEEIRTVEHLRSLGVFLRDRVGADATILTAWPGAIGYISRKEVLDLSGRAWPSSGRKRPNSWRGFPRVDVIGSLAGKVDYIVPMAWMLDETGRYDDFLTAWLDRFDTVGATQARKRELLDALAGFVLISVPVPAQSRSPLEPSETPFPLLQRRNLEKIPTLSLEIADGQLRAKVHHEGNQQVVDLCVRVSKKDGEELYLNPSGAWKSGKPVDARASLLVFQTGSRSIQFMAAELPQGVEGATLTAWLHNPGMEPEAPLSGVGPRVEQRL